MTGEFESIGESSGEVPVAISKKIIQLFSEGLYSSPNKAVEELVSNSFDAGATVVHVALSSDMRDSSATIAVFDDGDGMDPSGLEAHWIIGKSTRTSGVAGLGRKPIGKFGIGKLSTYVLAGKLTHISKCDGKYFAATMDYSQLDADSDGSEGVFDGKNLPLPLRELSEAEAQLALEHWTVQELGEGDGELNPILFGEEASDSWTAAILSDLKDLGQKVMVGRLRWILRTAMPQRPDFSVYLDGERMESPHTEEPMLRLVLGKEVKSLGRPCTADFQPKENASEAENSIFRYGLRDEEGVLGRLCGAIEIFESEIDRGKEKFATSNGFFVYVNGRQVNVDDPGFGIERNLLRHGTFSRFRMIVHADVLNGELRSSRESFQQGPVLEGVRNALRAAFNLARNRLEDEIKSKRPGAGLVSGVSSVPGSLTRRPLAALAFRVSKSEVVPRYSRFPSDHTPEQWSLLIDKMRSAESGDQLVTAVELDQLDPSVGFAVFDAADGVLRLNVSHPFVAAFQGVFSNLDARLAMEMFAMAEVLTEAHLYNFGLDEGAIRDILDSRDELLRGFVRSSSRRTAEMIANALQEARNDENQLEIEMRAAFEAIGFDDVIRISGPGKPDGTAHAHLAANEKGEPQRYKVGLEAKSGGVVSAARLNTGGIRRHLEDYECDHCLVIGNGFRTSDVEGSATLREIQEIRGDTGRTVTLMHIDDLARLVRLAPVKRNGGLLKLRELFKVCISPEECKGWIDELEAEEPKQRHYREILETIWALAQQRPDEPVEYAAIVNELTHCEPKIHISRVEAVEACRAMQVLTGGVVTTRDSSVELSRRPDLAIEDIRNAVNEKAEDSGTQLNL